MCALSPLQILMSALRHLVYVVNKLCVQMHQALSIVPAQMDSTHQVEYCGRLASHFVKVSKARLQNKPL